MEESSSQASLTILGGPKGGQSFDIEDSVDNIVIGSDPSCRFHIDLPGVSPVHARIWIDPQGVTVYETNSPRGLFVNDDRVVAQAPLRNGDVLWLGTPGDEDVVMIQCRFPQVRNELRTAYTVPPVDEDAPGETVALGARPAIPESEPEAEEAEAAAEAAPEEEPTITAQPAEFEPPRDDEEAAPPSPPTEVFIVDDQLAATPPSMEPVPSPSAAAIPREAPKFEVDFSKADLPAGFEEEIEGTVADVPAPELPPPPPVAAPPPPPEFVAPPSPSPAPAAEAPPPPRRETPAPARAEARPAPPPPRRAAARPAAAAPAAPASGEAARPGMPAAVKWGALAAGVVVLALGSFLVVRLMRGRPSTSTVATPPPPATTQATAPPTTVAMAAVEPTPAVEPEPSPTAVPVDEVVTIVAPPPPTTAAPAPTQRPVATPSASPRATPTPRPSQRAATAPPPTAPPAVDTQATQVAAQVAGLLGQAENAARGRSFEAAIRDYDEVLKLDPQNGRAAQGKADAQAAAASFKRSFAPGRTSISGKAAKTDGLGGFDTAGVTVAKLPDYSGRIEFEVSPAHVLPGDSYTVRIFLVNDGKKAFKLGSVSVNTTTNGSRAGGSVPVRARELEPKDRLTIDERTSEWPTGVNSWMLEAVVQTDRDAAFTNRLNWR